MIIVLYVYLIIINLWNVSVHRPG